MIKLVIYLFINKNATFFKKYQGVSHLPINLSFLYNSFAILTYKIYICNFEK